MNISEIEEKKKTISVRLFTQNADRTKHISTNAICVYT